MEEIAKPEILLDKLAEQLKTLLTDRSIDQPVMVGIHTGGAWIANALHQKLSFEEPLATLDISFYRDDFSRIGMNPQVKPSKLPPQIDDRHIILVDDVLHTGRTIRAAMNELFDYGRPASITLVCLVERSGREIPIQADVVGQHLHLDKKQHIKLTGPTPLEFVVA
ncbi:MAG: bifunctional pyr operon transcriptional regulator/uracil phosphoribosyltransferase PyrR [Gammaproteobacteria bacterium]|nr:bifunctional pyr operon transcriptional regulator/uracil phosphoribosyltransferase PyrR [Gammaproteobacteria bacterium]